MTSGGNGHSEPEHGSPAHLKSFCSGSGSGPACSNGPGSAPGIVGTNRKEIPVNSHHCCKIFSMISTMYSTFTF